MHFPHKKPEYFFWHSNLFIWSIQILENPFSGFPITLWMNTNFLTWLTNFFTKCGQQQPCYHPGTPTLSMCSNKIPRQVLQLEKHSWGDCSLNSPSALQLSDLLSRGSLLQARTVPATWGLRTRALCCVWAFTVALSLPPVHFLSPSSVYLTDLLVFQILV